MNKVDQISTLLAALNRHSATISDAYYQGRVHKTDENARDIEHLRQLRLLSPDIRDAFQLRASFRQFLKIVLNEDRLFATGADIGGYFKRLSDLVKEHSIAYQEGRDTDCERYEVETREAISDIADSIDDELIVLKTQVATRFAAVSTIAEKKRQNVHYQQRTNVLVEILENFHFSDIGDQLADHDELALSFNALLADRIPAFLESLTSILVALNQYLFEFRRIEDRVKRVHAFALHLKRNPDWVPKAWDEVTDPQDWLKCATPLALQTNPDVAMQESEEFLAEVARSVPAVAMAKSSKTTRPPGHIEDRSGNTVIRVKQPAARTAVHVYFQEAQASAGGISARSWWAANPAILQNTKENIWLLRVLAEHGNKGTAAAWSLRLVSRRDPVFDGNILIRDVIVAKKAA